MLANPASILEIYVIIQYLDESDMTKRIYPKTLQEDSVITP